MENEVVKRIQDYALEEIMGLRFGAYAKEIIQDRAIPDVRDGLKPVQRRILFDMYKNNNTYDKGYIKCAATVGDVLGKWHPHGDSSVYDAMVRMSQWWKQNNILIDMHGNNGSMDGDGAAAYRYTEARLSKIAGELLKDLDKNTVAWAPNFDDRFLEPTVLPAKFPNLLVNGTNGISAGYATNIPPHNLGEKNKGKEQIVITEIPFEVNKAMMVAKIDSIRIDKKLDGIAEIRDETDRDGVRIVIDLKSGANKDIIINYLLKNTDLQISYNYNMVAIVNRRPMTLGIIPLLDAYIEHQRETIIKRSRFDLEAYKKRLNIVDGFLKMMDILDQVIKVIRASKNKADAKINIINEFGFNEEQAEAIVVLQLYKLTNTDVLALEEERDNLHKYIEALELILSNEEKLKEVMKYELRKIKQEYAVPRKTQIIDQVEEIKIDTTDLITKENVLVCITNEGYIKRVSLKSYNSSNGDSTTLKPGDYVTNLFEVSTLDTILIFTNLGQYIYAPVHSIFEAKWKELGKHINNLVGGLSEEEHIVASFVLDNPNQEITTFTKNGLVKRSVFKDYVVSRYTKAMSAFKLKEGDYVVSVERTTSRTLMISANGYYVNIDSSEIPTVGPRASGVKGIALKEDHLIGGYSIDSTHEYLTLITNNKTAKRIKISELETHNRAKKGSSLIKKVKSFDYQITKCLLTTARDEVCIKADSEIKILKNSEIPIMDMKSTGSNISKYNIDDAFLPFIKLSYLDKKKEDTNIVNEESKPVEETPKEDIPVVKLEQSSLDEFFDEFKF